MLLLASLISIGGCSVNKGAQESPKSEVNLGVTIQPDSVAHTILGSDVEAILFAPDSVLVAKMAETTSSTRFSKTQTFEPVTPMTTVDSNDLKALQMLILADGHNYHNDSIMVMSPCMPAMQLNFHKNNAQVKMTVSFSDHTWMLEKDGKELLNFNYTIEEPLNRIYHKL